MVFPLYGPVALPPRFAHHDCQDETALLEGLLSQTNFLRDAVEMFVVHMSGISRTGNHVCVSRFV